MPIFALFSLRDRPFFFLCFRHYSFLGAGGGGGGSIFGRGRSTQAWEETAFTTLNHREQPGVFILGALEEILLVLEDNQVTLQTMMGSRFIMGVKDEVRADGTR